MKNLKYTKPKFEILYLDLCDVITVSDFYISDPDWFS